MLPDSIVKDSGVVSEFIEPENRGRTKYRAFSRGGIAINDASQGLNVRIWVVEYDEVTGNVSLYPEDGTEADIQYLFTMPDVYTIDLAFDQNMRPMVVYGKASNVEIYWYDTTQLMYVTQVIAIGAWPALIMDDVRQEAVNSGVADILLFYLLDGDLYMSRQRDRFETPIPLVVGQNFLRFHRCGMMTNNRVGFEILPLPIIPVCSDVKTKAPPITSFCL